MAVKANYETVMVISMKQGEEGIQALIEKFKALIEKHATLQSVDEWGKRKLAYLINKESEGYYVLMNFESDATFPAELDRRYKITDGIMRSLIIRKDDDAEVKAEEAKEETPVEAAAEEAAE
ncbi:MAG: 30S ribosomal protein S6 [Ruminococcus sp.]|nr:30S ribosomal protein S6 [Ruminococcus sp.]